MHYSSMITSEILCYRDSRDDILHFINQAARNSHAVKYTGRYYIMLCGKFSRPHFIRQYSILLLKIEITHQKQEKKFV